MAWTRRRRNRRLSAAAPRRRSSRSSRKPRKPPRPRPRPPTGRPCRASRSSHRHRRRAENPFGAGVRGSGDGNGGRMAPTTRRMLTRGFDHARRDGSGGGRVAGSHHASGSGIGFQRGSVAGRTGDSGDGQTAMRGSMMSRSAADGRRTLEIGLLIEDGSRRRDRLDEDGASADGTIREALRRSRHLKPVRAMRPAA